MSSTGDGPVAAAGTKLFGVKGVFRLSGAQSKINALRAEYDSGGDPDLFETNDPHVVAGLFKLYLRELTEPLLTFSLFHGWIAAGAADSLATRRDLYRALYAALPKPHRDLLRHLCAFLFRVQQFSAVNKMGVANLATVIGPNILRAPGASMMATVQYTPHINQITSDLIEIGNETFFEPPLAGPFEYIAVAQAQFPYAAQYEGELSFDAEAFLFVIHKDDDGWWEGNCNGMIGIFPHNYVKIFLVLKEGNGSPSMPVTGEADGTTASQPVLDEVEKIVSEALAVTAEPDVLVGPPPALPAVLADPEREAAAPPEPAAEAASEPTPAKAAKPTPAKAAKPAPAKATKPVPANSKDEPRADVAAAKESAAPSQVVSASDQARLDVRAATRTTMGGIGKKAVMAEVDRLRIMMDEDGKRFRELRRSYDGLVKHSARLDDLVVDVQAKAKKLERERVELDEKLSVKEAELKTLRGRIIESESSSLAERGELSAELASIRQQKSEVSETLAASEAEVRALKSKIRDLEIGVAEYEANEVNMRNEERRLNSLLKKAVGELKATRDANAALKARVARLEDESAKSAQSIKASLNSGVEAAQSELIETRLELQRARAKLAETDTLQLQVNHLVQERTRLQKELETATNAARSAHAVPAADPAANSAAVAKAKDETRRLAAIAQDLTRRLKLAEAKNREVDSLRAELQQANIKLAAGGGGGGTAGSRASIAGYPVAASAGAGLPPVAPVIPSHRQASAPVYSATASGPGGGAGGMSLEDELNALEAELASGLSGSAAASRRPSAREPTAPPSLAASQLASLNALADELGKSVAVLSDPGRYLPEGEFTAALQGVGTNVKAIKRALDSETNAAYDVEGHAVALVKFAMTMPTTARAAHEPQRTTLRERAQALSTAVTSAIRFWRSRHGV
ncbi:uncharacterized protein AMSG_06237 [Thecamonas trahens ATCC 50062]|uniref:Rho-GAP domain-containing protein n=1 Tax=Thecamonas trahens ATCC 50062 TaxID=461836 RepID=A0A0L0DCT6_THETB|nr:hypothetical protein AMSG_06237 [Thecamonas trahens ATCC 50062]KNC49931.1 hypothetical protein AMSG_06237 [Thecamonas trahens ATCC 50062]|eukprot:XP_013757409.1 hypothetical protein AMSG_06237 [Thecamonas trahens ATCC 50062]